VARPNLVAKYRVVERYNILFFLKFPNNYELSVELTKDLHATDFYSFNLLKETDLEQSLLLPITVNTQDLPMKLKRPSTTFLALH
jgi:hypothetical protein